MNLFGWIPGFVMVEIDEGKRKFFEYLPALPLFYPELAISERAYEYFWWHKVDRPNNILGVDMVYDEYLTKAIFAILDRMKVHHPRMYSDVVVKWNEEYARVEHFSRVDMLADLNDKELLETIAFCKEVTSGGGYDHIVYRDDSFFLREFIQGFRTEPFEDLDEDFPYEAFQAGEYNYVDDIFSLIGGDWTDDDDDEVDEDTFQEEADDDEEDFEELEDTEEDDDDDIDGEVDDWGPQPEVYHYQTTYSEVIAFFIVSGSVLLFGIFLL